MCYFLIIHRIHRTTRLEETFKMHVPIFLFCRSHLSSFFTLSWRNLVKLKLYKVICLDVIIKLPRDIYLLHQPFIAKLFAHSLCDQGRKTGPICPAVLYSLSSLKAAEKPENTVFMSQVLIYVIWFPLTWDDCVLWKHWGCQKTENIKSIMWFQNCEWILKYNTF